MNTNKLIDNINNGMGIIPFFLLILAFLIVLIVLLVSKSHSRRLNSIKAKKVGDGQHGTDRLLEEKELKEKYTNIIIPKEIVDMSSTWKPGRIIHYMKASRTAIVDTSATHAFIEAPTEVGKTTTYVIPNIQYNLMAGASMVVPSIKEELINLTIEDAKKLGYKTYIIDFANPGSSIGYDFFARINEALDRYKKSKDLMDMAEAETLAKRQATSIVMSKERSSNENQFFSSASLSLVHAFILLNAMFAEPCERHYSSVRATIQDLLQMKDPIVNNNDKTKYPKIQKLLGDLPNDFAPKKHVGAAFAATNETEDNIFSSVLNDLAVFNDSLAEQIISLPTKKECFDYHSLINEKSIVYINMPETKKELHMFAKMIISDIAGNLADLANTEYAGKLPRTVKILWDETGLSPKIEDFDQDLSINRSKGLLYDLIFQDMNQPKKTYGEEASKIMLNQCAYQIVLGIAATNTERAKELSEAVGKKTIMGGSVTHGNTSGSGSSTNSSITQQMMERDILSVGEILRMESRSERLLFIRGNYAFLAYFPPYYDSCWALEPSVRNKQATGNVYHPVDYFLFDELKKQLNQYRLENGIQFESSIDIEFIPDPSISESPAVLDSIVSIILNETDGDLHAVKLLTDEKYVEFMDYMKKYKSKLTRFELQALIEPLAN